MKNEIELFKTAYMNLKNGDHVPFPDAVFDEYIRLRDNEGFKLVPVEANTGIDYEYMEQNYKAK